MSRARRLQRVARLAPVAALVWVSCAAFACVSPTKPAPRSKPAPAPPSKAEPAAPTPRPRASQVKIRGLHGTLNDSDVHQTMEGRQAEFSRCIALSRRSLRWVSGDIRFAFKVDAEGQIADLRYVESTIGHRVLEQCLASVVAQTQFRKPSGGATARFDWRMSVEPATGRQADELDPERLKPLLRKRTRELVLACDIDRARERYRITAYVDKRGRMLSAGGVASPPDAQDKMDCVLHEIARWRMPKYKHHGKLMFELR